VIVGCAVDPLCDLIIWRGSVPRYILDIFKTGSIPGGVAALVTWLCEHGHLIEKANINKQHSKHTNRNKSLYLKSNIIHNL
jgi:hypothetical protein